jgi:cell division protein FtsW (lipid II flippase)
MVQIILLIIGVTALFKKSIAVTKKTELRQPKLRKFGIITIIMLVIAIISDNVLPEGTDLKILIYPICFLFLIRQEC